MKLRWMSALLIVALVGWVGAVSAQQAPAPAPAQPAPPPCAEKMMEGKVKAVDQAKKQVTLEDGTTLTIPAAVQVQWTSIKPGSTVMVSYVEAGQKKTVGSSRSRARTRTRSRSPEAGGRACPGSADERSGGRRRARVAAGPAEVPHHEPTARIPGRPGASRGPRERGLGQRLRPGTARSGPGRHGACPGRTAAI